MTLPDGLPWDSALVTGASSGIGEAVARLLGGHGVGHLVLVARRADRLGRLAAELGRAHGTEVEVLAADLADGSELARVEQRLADSDRPVDLLVNNAGLGTSGAFATLPSDGEEHEILVNVVALVRLTRAVLPGQIDRERGAVLNVSSMASYQPSPGNATYGASKAFVTSFSEAVHEEVRGSGVTVTALCPGYTRTEFQGATGGSQDRVPGFAWTSAESVAEAGLAGAAAGRALVVPGLGYKLIAGVTTPLPRSAKRWIMGRAAGTLSDRGRLSGVNRTRWR
jgi:short-subunit dehydrogenase